MIDLLNPPPIRTPLQVGDSVDATAKEWYYFWTGASDQINANTIKLDGLVTSGTHAHRPDAVTMPEGALYVESDRGAIYQVQVINGKPVWKYLAGTMWGTLTPDQRPTDLGVYDAGFDFRGTDQAREFIWSQTAWIEATAVRYGTHAARPASATVADGVLYVETDRGNVVYQQQADAWHYAAGVMRGTISPDQRPTDLGGNDTGFRFTGTDQLRQFTWNGSAWIEYASSGLAIVVRSTASLTLTPTATAIPGATITLTRPGTYLITGFFTFNSNDAGVPFRGGLTVNGADQGMYVIATGPAGSFFAASQQWPYAVGAGASATANLVASKDSGGGTSFAQGAYTTITAQWISP